MQENTILLKKSVLLAACTTLAMLCGGRADAAAIYADQVVSFQYGSGPTHNNFSNPLDTLGAQNYSGGLYGTGSYSLGTGGKIVLRMSSFFSGGGSAAPDLFIYEIGPSFGAAAEGTLVEVSSNALNWFNVGNTSGGSGSIDLDAFGIGTSSPLRFVRLTDISVNTSTPAGADIDSVKAVNAIAVSEPASAISLALGTFTLLPFLRQRNNSST